MVVTLKSLNHRGLDLHFHAPPEFDALRERHAGGDQEGAWCAAMWMSGSSLHAREQDRRVGLESSRCCEAYLAAFRKAAAEHGTQRGSPDLNAAFRMPGMFRRRRSPEPDAGLGAAAAGGAGGGAGGAERVPGARRGANWRRSSSKHNRADRRRLRRRWSRSARGRCRCFSSG